MALADNLVSYWKLDESSGNAADSVGSNTLTNTNTITYTTGKINNGATLLNASAQYFTTASGSTFNFASTFSIGMWINPSASIAVDWLAGCRVTTLKWQFSLRANAALEFSIWQTNDTAKTIQVNHTFNNGTWYYVTAVADGSYIRIYANGVELGSGTAYDGTIKSSTEAVLIGNADNDAGRFYSGMVDEVGIWSRVLTPTEVTALYNGGAGLQYPFATSYTLDCTTQTYALTGVNIDINRSWMFGLSTGAFTLTGINIAMNRAINLICQTGAFILTGIDIGITYVGKWVNRVKNSSSYTNGTKNSSSWTEGTKNSSSWTNQTKL